MNANGHLQVIISGLPNGVPSNVVVTGPNGFNQTVTANQTFTDISPGSYSIVVNVVSSGDYSYRGGTSGSSFTVNPLGVTTTAQVAYAAFTGALRLAISGVPANGNVVITGPGDFRQVVAPSTSQVVPRLLPGDYTIARTARATGLIVDEVYEGAGANATVTPAATAAAAATFALRSGSGKVWVEVLDSTSGYDASQLQATGNPAPSVSIGSTGVQNEAVAFDSNGNLWGTVFFGALRQLTPQQLAISASPTPKVTISGPSLSGCTGLAFDAAGNLWVANFEANTVVKFTPALLASTGEPAAAVVISANAGSLNSPLGLAFDSRQNLWVSNAAFAGPTTIVMFTPQQLAATGSPVPAVTLSGASFNRPFHLAFDGSGNLWVPNLAANNIAKFIPAQLSASGAPVPTITLSGPATNDPGAVAFDNGGNLWVSSISGHTITKLNAFDLLVSGSPPTAVTIGGLPGSSTTGFAFNPPSGSSFIFH